MTVDLKAAAFTLNGLRPYPVAVTTVAGGRANGLIALSSGSGSILAEAPRVMIGLTKFNLTHDLVKESGVFVKHLLATGSDELLAATHQNLMQLGGSSGRDGDKLAGLRTKEGVTGSPILLDALAYVEGRVVTSMDADENTVFLADVVGAEKLSDGSRLGIGEAWGKLPHDWIEQYEANHEPQLQSARDLRAAAAARA
jgi:flavin reductase (DIM6/NTAB) family NADH-FMN oxidoreductase RutF